MEQLSDLQVSQNRNIGWKTFQRATLIFSEKKGSIRGSVKNVDCELMGKENMQQEDETKGTETRSNEKYVYLYICIYDYRFQSLRKNNIHRCTLTLPNEKYRNLRTCILVLV